VFIPPAGGVAQSNWFVEPLSQSPSDFNEGFPDLFKLTNGSPVTGSYYEEISATVDPIYDSAPYHNAWDGDRNDNGASPYSNCVSSLDAGNPLYYCVSLDGRLYSISGNGLITTIAGLRTKTASVPFYWTDHSQATPTSSQEVIGSFDAMWVAPNDLAIDPRNHRIYYIADTENHRIARVDTTGTPVITTYAGNTGSKGYVNGSCTAARFNLPFSLVMQSDGTLYVADQGNNVIRKITSSCTVSTLVGIGYPGSPTPEPSTTVVANAPTTYCGTYGTPVAFASAYINYPFAIRLDTTGNLLLDEPATACIRLINPTAQTVTQIAELKPKGDSSLGWSWLDVDTQGTIGPVNQVVATAAICGGAACAFKFPETGDPAIPPAKFPLANCALSSSIHFGDAGCTLNPYGHYSWAVAIHRAEGRVAFMGYGSLGVFSFHIRQTSDPTWAYSGTNYSKGRGIWETGTVAGWPWGSRPNYSSVHGHQGFARGGLVENIDDMVAMPDDSTFCSATYAAGTLQAYLQNGAEGTSTRPEITGNDMRDLTYYVRRLSVNNATTQVAVPGPSCSGTQPVISNVHAGTTITWSTQVPALGVVQYGTNAGQYFAWSNIESSYSMSHSVTLSNLPATGSTIYFQVQSKDVSGLQAVVVTGSFTN
jgi:hypothetical protein